MSKRPTHREQAPHRGFATLGIMGLLALLPGCLSLSEPPSTFEEVGRDANTRGLGSRFPVDPNRDEFTFGVGDQLLITMPGTSDFDAELIVGANGSVRIPFLKIGELPVGGLTEDEVERKIELLLASEFVDNDVVVSRGTVASKKIYVGAIDPNTGGLLFQTVDWTGNDHLFDVWVRIGSPSTVLDDDTHIRVIRADPRQPQVLIVNIRELATQGYSGANILLRPDDIVFVPPTFLGEVNRFLSTISLPLQSLSRLTSAVVSVRRSADIIQGDDVSRFQRF